MNYVGIDIGSTASKVVSLGDKNIEFVLPTGWSSKETVDEIKNRLLSYEIDVCDDNTKVVATGYGRISVDFADKTILEVKDLYTIVFIGASGVSCNVSKLGSIILPPAE